MTMQYTVILERDEDGVYIATVPVLPGCVSDGGTKEETLKNVREAIELYIETLRAHNEAIPQETGREIVEINA